MDQTPQWKAIERQNELKETDNNSRKQQQTQEFHHILCTSDLSDM